MMKLSVIGTGRMGKGIMNICAPFFQEITWGSRSVDRTQKIIEEHRFENVRAVSYEEALQADVIIHTLWFKHVIGWAQEYRDQLTGKILVDVANPFNDDFSDFTTGWGTSAAEELQKVVPSTIVVGAFKNTFFSVFANPIHHGLKSDVYVTADDKGARELILKLLEPLPFRLFDAGLLQNNRTIERMTLFEREMAIRYGHYPYVSFRLFGSDQK